MVLPYLLISKLLKGLDIVSKLGLQLMRPMKVSSGLKVFTYMQLLKTYLKRRNLKHPPDQLSLRDDCL
jgi:hypothetical protein